MIEGGYAHYDAHKEGVTGIGAYNDDGTLKSNASVFMLQKLIRIQLR